MNKLLLAIFFLIILNPINGQTDNSGVKLRVYNNSYYTIDSYIFTFEGVKTELKNIKPKSYSKTVEINGFWEYNSYEITFTKKKFFFWKGFATKIVATSFDHIGDKKILKGNFTLKISINRETRIKIDYIEDK